MTDFKFQKDSQGIATITWDCPGKSMNIMTFDAMILLDKLIDEVLSDQTIKGAIINSGKKDFAAGMDLNILAKWKKNTGNAPAHEIFDSIMFMHKMFRKIERAGMEPNSNNGGKPIVTVMSGTALGIGFELPLATHRIFAANNPKAKIGLPEIMVGLFPGAGGSVRLVRKLGAMAAAPYLLEGKTLSPDRAKLAGIIDEVSDDPLAEARTWVLNAKHEELVKPWDKKGYKLPGGTPFHPSGFMTFIGASAMVNGKTQGAFPAAKALLSAVYEGALVPFETALKIEARWFTNIVLNPCSAAMIRSLFINKSALEKGAVRPKGIPDQSVKKIGILGAGMMGAGISLVSARSGIEVVLFDQTQEAADKGKAYSEAFLEKGIKLKKSTLQEKENILAKIAATSDITALKDVDLVIEAVFEDPKVKSEIIKAVENIVSQDCIFASNTSTLPITELAQSSIKPDKFIGIHFFSPVEKMMLVEIIKGKQTGKIATAKALDYVRQIKKTPIVVNDARFFYANRCIIPYINEGIRLVAEGTSPALIDNAAKMLGFPIGPLQLVDETSIDLGAKIARATKKALGTSYPDSMVDSVLFWLEGEGRLGRKSKAGFFDYDETGKRMGYWEGLSKKFPRQEKQPELLEVQDRLMFSQALEAVRALEEGVLMDVREGDVGAVLGWGFAPWSGGPISWIDLLGPAYIAERCDQLQTLYGKRFACPKLLRDLAQKNQSFYSHFNAA